MLAGIISLMTKADSLDEPAFMSVNDIAATVTNSSLFKLLQFIALIILRS